jgi:hypothetical protein
MLIFVLVFKKGNHFIIWSFNLLIVEYLVLIIQVLSFSLYFVFYLDDLTSIVNIIFVIFSLLFLIFFTVLIFQYGDMRNLFCYYHVFAFFGASINCYIDSNFIHMIT